MGFWSDSFPSAGSESSISSELPQWYQSYIQNLTGKAAAVADMPVEAYPGQRIAGFTDPQTQAFDLTQQNVGAWKPGLQQAQDLTTQSSTYNPGALSQFMNPYTSNVVDEMGRLGNQNFTETLMPAANAAFTGAGQFGSTRNQDSVNRIARDTQAMITGKQGEFLNQGFNTANTNYLNWAGKGQAGALQGAGLVDQGQRLGTADAAALSGVGALQQAQGQKNLDVAYGDFQQQQQQPVQNLTMLNSIIRGMQVPPAQKTQYDSGLGAATNTGATNLSGALTNMASLFQ